MENNCESGKDACCSGSHGCESQCGQGACNDKGCCEGQCGCQSAPCPSEWCDCMGCKLTMLARRAKMKVLMHKMEEHIERVHGKKLDAKAKIAVEHLFRMWELENESEEKQQAEQDDYNKKLEEAMND